MDTILPSYLPTYLVLLPLLGPMYILEKETSRTNKGGRGEAK